MDGDTRSAGRHGRARQDATAHGRWSTKRTARGRVRQGRRRAVADELGLTAGHRRPRRHARQGTRKLRRLRRGARRALTDLLINRARLVHLHHRACRLPRSAAAEAAIACLRCASRSAPRGFAERVRTLAEPSSAKPGSTVPEAREPDPARPDWRERSERLRRCRGSSNGGRLRGGHPPAHGAGGHLAPAPFG